MRPLLEYAAVVWDSCTELDKNRLEQLQFEAARVVTGLTRSVSINNLIEEIGWISLNDRRKLQKLVIMYKLKNGLLPEHFSTIFPRVVGEENNYNLRNADNFIVMARRTALFSNSFVPSSVDLWNTLTENIRTSPTLSSFKYRLKCALFKQNEVPSYYYKGSRSLTVLQTRLRNGCSNLNADLCNNHLKDDPICDCERGVEDAEHYFFKCPLFLNQRIALFRYTRQYHPLSVRTLLKGKEELSDEENLSIFNSVQKFIHDTARFSN